MPDQILPITQLDAVGVVKDMPPVSLPPNAFSDVANVRFRDGAVRKMEGEINAFPYLFNDTDSEGMAISYNGYVMKYVAWWPNPNIITENKGYYLVIAESPDGLTDEAFLVAPGIDSEYTLDTDIANTEIKHVGTFIPDRDGNWQHTFFQGGFSLVINNGLQPPHYILDGDGNINLENVPEFEPLPGWESYNVESITDEYNEDELGVFEFTREYDFDDVNLIVSVQRDTEMYSVTVDQYSTVFTLDEGSNFTVEAHVQPVMEEDVTVLEFANILVGDVVTITLQYLNVNTTAGVIRSFGDFLVAGNIRETYTDTVNGQTEVIRNLAGIVRTSDAAAPGAIPQNWNPFAVGVSTAEEFVLTNSGIVQDMVELQGNLYIYANSSIAAMRRTGNTNVPLAVSLVTESYGAQTTDAVLEFDGKHFIVGSQDMYLFGGHPGSIQSVSDRKVRHYFFERLNPLHVNRMFCLRYAQRDEIWIVYPTTGSISGECDEALIWNYRNQTWTIRTLESVVAGDVGPLPGGGLPTSSYNVLEGGTGDNEPLSNGRITIQQFSDRGNFRVNSPRNNGQPTIHRLRVDGVTPFTAADSATFDLVFNDEFDTGPNADDGDTPYSTEAAHMAWAFVGSEINEELALPRYLTVDQPWDSERFYFFGQRVLSQAGDTDTEQVVWVRVGDPDRVYPELFYNVDTDIIYDSDSDMIYDDPDNPNDIPHLDADWKLVTDTDALYYVTIDDVITAIPYDSDIHNVRPTDVRTLPTVVQILKDWLVQDTDTTDGRRPFHYYYDILEVPNSDTEIIIQGRGVANKPFTQPNNIVTNYPAGPYTMEFSDTSGTGNVGSVIAADIQGAHPELEIETQHHITFTSEEYSYVVDSDILNNGYELTDGVVDNIIMTLAGDYTGNADTKIARNIRDFFHNHPRLAIEWDTMYNANDSEATIESMEDAYYQVTMEPGGDSEFQMGTFEVITDQFGIDTDEQYPPVFRLTAPDSELGQEPVVVGVYGYDPDTSLRDVEIDSDDVVEYILSQVKDIYGNWRDSDQFRLFTDSDTDQVPDLSSARRNADTDWTIELVDRGSTGTHTDDLPEDLPIIEATTVQAGFLNLLATPTYMGMLISTGGGGFEFLVVELPLDEDDAETIAENLQRRISDAFPRLSVIDRGSEGEFIVQPANYNDLANFVLETRFNDTAGNAQWIYDRATGIVDGVVLNPASDDLFINTEQTDDVFDTDQADVDNTSMNYFLVGGPLKIMSKGGDSVSDTEFSQIMTTFDIDIQTTFIFDVERPWPHDEINNNLEYPILASTALRQDTDTGLFHNVNKILGCDIGFSRPTYDLRAREDMEDSTAFIQVITGGSDLPEPYESYVERIQSPVSPEFTTEQIQSLALWADGETIATLRGSPEHNRLDLIVRPSNYPGESVLLNADAFNNVFEITDDYKVDVRQHGRFMNYKITDAQDTDADSETGYNFATQWRLSGMQIEVKEGGKR